MIFFCWNGNRPCLLRCHPGPLSHYAISTFDTPGSQEALADAPLHSLSLGHPCLGNITIAGPRLFGFRKKRISFINTLKPLFGKSTNGILGKIVDTITVVATVIRVATTLGFGAAQINGDSTTSFGIPNNALVQSYYHHYHNRPLYHFSPFWSWKGVKSYQTPILF